MICAKRVSIIDAELTLALWVYLMPASKSGATQNLLSLQENADLEHPVNFVQLKVASDGSVFFNYGISDATKDSATAADFRLNYRQWTHLAVTLAAGSIASDSVTLMPIAVACNTSNMSRFTRWSGQAG